jgi:hypothetical protein
MARPRTQEAAYLYTILGELQAIRKLLEGVLSATATPDSGFVTEAMPASAPTQRTPRKRKAAQE